MESLCHPLLLAIATLFRHRLDVPAGLCTRWVSDGVEGGRDWDTQREPERFLLHSSPSRRRNPRFPRCREFRVPASGVGSQRSIHLRCAAISANPGDSRCAQALSYIDCLPPFASHCTRPDQIMKSETATVALTPTSRKSSIAWK